MLRMMRNTTVSVEYQNWNGDAPEKEKKNPHWSLPSSSMFEFCLSFQCLLQPSVIALQHALVFISHICAIHAGDSYGHDLTLRV